MRNRSLFSVLILAAMLIAATTIFSSKPVGEIRGQVTDSETGYPIVGASVIIEGTRLGSMTGHNGEYVISQLEPGTYSLLYTHVRYKQVKVTDVEVKANDTVYLPVQMVKDTTRKPDKIVVEAKRDALHVFEVSSGQTLTQEQIEVQPVTTVQDLLKQTAGVVTGREGEIFVRGGRAGEVSYILDKAALIAPGGCVPGFPPAHGGTSIVNGEPFDAMFFKHYGVNPFVDTEDDHLSTFAIDVDDASYVMTRSYLNRGYLPPDEAVRTEEFVNHFDYHYSAPQNVPFEVYLEGAPSRFGPDKSWMLKIGIKGKKILAESRKPANLVFVIDVSGSMAREDRLTLVKKALRLLLDELRADDRVGIVVYGSRGRVLLELTSIERELDIVAAIEQLCPGGSTNAEEGLRLGYDMAERHFEKGKINRIILCSDGVANVGRTSAEDFLKWIKSHADRGITLTTVGFGMGNYNDILMEKLGDKGNGHYAYVDNLPEARRVFVENLTGTLQVIARDVKIQVDFNPDVVRSYRLLGYENRDVDDDKFRDDKEDGGEIGAGHEVTALYEVKFHKELTSNDVGTVYIRYKDPDEDEVTEISRTIRRNVFRRDFRTASLEFKLATAAAEFAEILHKSYWAKDSKLGDVLALVKEIAPGTEDHQVIELMHLVSRAQQYEQQLAEK
ncbi:MAG: von Willebrand factor type A domain-containing protein [Candidatus Zixiibacteriota bacterium]